MTDLHVGSLTLRRRGEVWRAQHGEALVTMWRGFVTAHRGVAWQATVRVEGLCGSGDGATELDALRAAVASVRVEAMRAVEAARWVLAAP